MSKSFEFSVSHRLYFRFTSSFLSQVLPTKLDEDWSVAGSSSQGTIYSTMIGLKEAGCDVVTTTEWPDQGVVIAHPLALPKRRPTHYRSLFIICWQQDYMRCDYANLHLVMNQFMTTPSALSLYDRLFLPGPSVVLHFLPELSLIPRDSARANRFENIAYLGAPKNLKPEFQNGLWHHNIHELGLSFFVRDAHEKRANYSEIDCVTAVRPTDQQLHQKPPSKLWNAWRAGVPAILGPEPGFRDYRKSELDYIEVENSNQALAALKRLRDEPDLRLAMVENGKQRAQECSASVILDQWKQWIEGPLSVYVEEWFEGPASRRAIFGAARSIRIALRMLRLGLKGLTRHG